jgi:hypothetical protein
MDGTALRAEWAPRPRDAVFADLAHDVKFIRKPFV